MPYVVSFVCLNCGKEKTSKNTTGKYCSNKCQRQYERKAALENGTISPRSLRHYLIEKDGKCSSCGISDWNRKPIVLELEHKNGNSEDNSLDNVCLLCPNCHSQTDTYKGKNRGNGRHSRRQRYHDGLSY